MTETRYFYTDPLAAAWMMFHQGVKIDGNSYARIRLDKFCTKIEVYHMEDWFAPKFYVHPDSLPLLTPRVGDLVTNTFRGNHGRECSGVVESMANGGASAVITTCERHNGKRHFFESVSQLIVLQRDGKPFHWPESEAA